MEFTVAKTDLVRELGLSQGVVEKRTTIPILSNVLIQASGSEITLTTTDLELAVRSSCAAQVKKPGAGTLPAKRLLDYVRLLPDADIQVKVADNYWTSLTCGRSRTRIAGMSQDSFPELPQMGEPSAELPAKALADMITQTIFAISAEESRFTLNGALLLIKPELLSLVATDGHRLALVERPVETRAAEPIRALVPRKALQEILKIFGESGDDARIQFGATENHLFFHLGKRLLLSRKLTGNFPDYERVLPKQHPHVLSLSRDELRSSIERVSQFSDERTRAVKFKMAPGELIIHSSLSETGESEESIPATYDGSAQEIGFNAQYILEFLRADPEDEVRFLFKDASNAGELRPGGEDLSYNYRYIIMPMRI